MTLHMLRQIHGGKRDKPVFNNDLKEKQKPFKVKSIRARNFWKMYFNIDINNIIIIIRLV